jgi:hypothetical protein
MTPNNNSRPADEEFLKQMLGRQKRYIVDRASQFGASGLPSAEQLAETVAFAPRTEASGYVASG